jgi:hypothetical protein
LRVSDGGRQEQAGFEKGRRGWFQQDKRSGLPGVGKRGRLHHEEAAKVRSRRNGPEEYAGARKNLRDIPCQETTEARQEASPWRSAASWKQAADGDAGLL